MITSTYRICDIFFDLHLNVIKKDSFRVGTKCNIGQLGPLWTPRLLINFDKMTNNVKEA